MCLDVNIAPFKCSTSDTKVKVAKCSISNLVYGSSMCRDDKHRLPVAGNRGLPSSYTLSYTCDFITIINISKSRILKYFLTLIG